MSKDQRQSVAEVMNGLEGVELRERKGRAFNFILHFTGAMKNAPIEELDLKPRAYNGLRRAGYTRIGEVVDDFSILGGKDPKRIRGCGAGTAREIKERLFLFQYYSLSPSEQEQYLIETVLVNLDEKGLKLALDEICERQNL